MDRQSIVDEMERACDDFHRLVVTATEAELRQQSNGTKWTNDQLLFHMLFGYLIVRTLLILVRALARAPRSVSKQFAAVLNSAAAPFHVVNYVGSLGGARVLGHSGMNKAFDLVVAHLVTSLEKDPDSELRRGMHFPVGWDPYFQEHMTIEDVYHYTTLHYDHHRRQLTLAATAGS